MSQEQQVTVTLPNPMTVGEMMAKGMTQAQAENKMNEMVFGVGYRRDDKGMPIEVGKGSAAQPTPQHLAALALANSRKAANSNLMTPGGIAEIVQAVLAASAGTTVNADIIAAAVAAGVEAGIKRAADNEKF